MRQAVAKAIDNEIKTIKDQSGIKRLTKEKQAEIEAYSSTIQQLKTLYKTL
jgi:archaellum component FlaC